MRDLRGGKTMKKLMMIVVAAGMAVCPALYANADPSAEPSTERVDLAKTAELKGDVARARTNYAAAVSHYLDAVKISQQNPLLYNKLGVTELQLGDRSQARKYFAKALKIDPRNTTALNNLGAVNCIQGKYKAAIRYLKEALALDESDASAHLNIAEAWIGVGETDRGMKEYARALELNADILSSTLDGVTAQVRTPAQRAMISFLIAKAYAKRGNLDGALEYLRRAKDDGYRNLSKVYEEPEFALLVQDPRLAKIVKK
jgi:tetratricopeptide (TPR) repeat protein